MFKHKDKIQKLVFNEIMSRANKKIFTRDHKKNLFFRAPMTSRQRTTATYNPTSLGE
jgi:Tfp pilus assembly ATPase PilU